LLLAPVALPLLSVCFLLVSAFPFSSSHYLYFFSTATSPTETYTLSLHDALPISTWQFTECTDIWANSSAEVTEIIFIVIARIQNDGIFILHRFVKLFRL